MSSLPLFPSDACIQTDGVFPQEVCGGDWPAREADEWDLGLHKVHQDVLLGRCLCTKYWQWVVVIRSVVSEVCLVGAEPLPGDGNSPLVSAFYSQLPQSKRPSYEVSWSPDIVHNDLCHPSVCISGCNNSQPVWGLMMTLKFCFSVN